MPVRTRAASKQEDEEGSVKRVKTEPKHRDPRTSNKLVAEALARVSAKGASRTKTTKAQPKLKKKDVKPGRSDSAVPDKTVTELEPASKTISKSKKPPVTTEDSIARPAYWLMKAEPESRIEKGKDVKFSIDDLAATDKEPWDGVRNPTARNNMRAMKKGELAFFYHSNCKIPGIAGIMKIEDEHSIDESAFNPDHPYYDEKSSRESPKWSLVHVKFLKKLDNLVSLKELQKHSQAGGELADMQVLRMSRLSVSKVSKQEWDFICKELAMLDPESLDSIV